MLCSIIIVGAGKGERFGQPKLLVPLAGKTLLQWNLETISELHFDHETIVVVPPQQVENIQSVVPEDVQVVAGGSERLLSVQNGLDHCSGDIVMIHNVANPLASRKDYQSLYQTLVNEDCAAFVGQPVVDTLRRVGEGDSQTLNREHLWRVQTPQAFRKQSLQDQLAVQTETTVTDEVSLMEKAGISVKALNTSSFNQKVTFPEDLEMLEQVLGNEVLIGIGQDSHRFDTNGTMTLGGVKIEGVPKLKGNSDGDVILHALYNAVSSALGGRSIGPLADPMAEEGTIESDKYLHVVLQQAQEQGYGPYNVSISLEGSQPKIEPLVDQLKENLSQLLRIDPSRIGITATTGEDLSSFGRGEGIHCTCVVSLSSSYSHHDRNEHKL